MLLDCPLIAHDGLQMIAHLMAEASADECIAERLSLLLSPSLSSGTATFCTRRLTKQSARPGAAPNKPPTVAPRRPTDTVRTLAYEAEGALARGMPPRSVPPQSTLASISPLSRLYLASCPALPPLGSEQYRARAYGMHVLTPQRLPSVASRRNRAVGSTTHTILPSISLCQVEGTPLL